MSVGNVELIEHQNQVYFESGVAFGGGDASYFQLMLNCIIELNKLMGVYQSLEEEE